MNPTKVVSISQEHYDPNSSLKDDIDFLCDPHIDVTDENILNIIVKYIYCYFYNNSVDTNIPLDRILGTINHITDYISKRKQTDEEDITSPIDGQEYALEMLLDIGSSVEIFKDIITRYFAPDQKRSRYLGIDLCSGTGILTLAQYIQARRNSFYQIENVGFELETKVVEFSNRLLQILGVGRTYEQDTTCPSLFSRITEEVSFISNETISDPHTRIDPNLPHSDPFVQNNANIFTYGKSHITTATQFFPQKVLLILDFNGEKSRIEACKENSFLWEEMLHIEDTGMLESWLSSLKGQGKLHTRWNTQFQHDSIWLSGKYIPLGKVGDSVYLSKMITPNGVLRPRWSY